MKLLHAPLLLALALVPSQDAVELVYAPEEGTRLKRLFVAEAEYRLTDVSASIDGEPLERRGEMPEETTRFVERIGVTDVLEAVADGRPTALVRTFDELVQEDEATLGEEERSGTLTSDLAGRTVRFTWDADEERYAVAAEDDEDLDEEVAARLLEDMDLRLVLPDGAVEPGDEWELDPRLYVAFMWPGGLLGFHPEGEEAGDDETSQQTIDRLEGTGTARLEEVREEDGTRVAVIAVELEITTGSEYVEPADEEAGQPEVAHEVEIERSLSGTILWDLDHGHALSAELECEASRLQTFTYTIEGEPEGEPVSAEVEQSRLLEGTIRYTATFARE